MFMGERTCGTIMREKVQRQIVIKFTFFSSHQEDRAWSWVRYFIEMMKVVIEKAHDKNKVEILVGERKLK